MVAIPGAPIFMVKRDRSPSGYANEVLDLWDPAGMRHEDHVGHKIE
jgi:hypothetical protein